MERKAGLVWDPIYLEHKPGMGHPERPQRLVALRGKLEEEGFWEAAEHVPAREATAEELATCHTLGHIEQVESVRGNSHTMFDAGDTQGSEHSVEAAHKAAGATIDLVRRVAERELDWGVGLVRPPGHHAEANRAMGFCIYNNIAVAVRCLQETTDIKKVLVIDWDVHHGNGTQHSFEDDPSVLYFSTHQYPFFPGTGSIGEVGEGDGEGYTINVPMPWGMKTADYLAPYVHLLKPVADQFEPEMVLVSGGFDAHTRDPIGGMHVSTEGFATIAALVKDIADRHCGGRLAMTLEGGYDLLGLSDSVATVARVFGGEPAPDFESHGQPGDVPNKLIDAVQDLHGGHWSF